MVAVQRLFQCPHCLTMNANPFPLGMLSTIQNCGIQCRYCGRMFSTGTVSRGERESDVVQRKTSPLDATAFRMEVEKTADSIKKAKDDKEIGDLLDTVANDEGTPEPIKVAAKWLKKYALGKISKGRIAWILLAVLQIVVMQKSKQDARSEMKTETPSEPQRRDTTNLNFNFNFTVNVDGQMNQLVEQSRDHEEALKSGAKEKGAGGH